MEKKTNEIVDVIVQKMYLFETWKFERERDTHTQNVTSDIFCSLNEVVLIELREFTII